MTQLNYMKLCSAVTQSYLHTCATVLDEVKEAWAVLSDNIPDALAQESPKSLVIGLCVWGVTVLFLIFLMFLDCSSMKSCTNRCSDSENTKQVS